MRSILPGPASQHIVHTWTARISEFVGMLIHPPCVVRDWARVSAAAKP